MASWRGVKLSKWQQWRGCRLQAAVRCYLAQRLASILRIEQHTTHVAARPSEGLSDPPLQFTVLIHSHVDNKDMSGWVALSPLELAVYFKATDPFSERWQSAWIITAFWDVLAFVLLLVICYLWAPSQSSQRYAYSGEAADDDDEESQSLTKGDGEVGMVKIDKDRNAGVSSAFGLEDEAEEDKRE
ncbi:Lung seven transmembrane receptor family protein [Zea mays]|uniref:Lung seven transmembrane receptor family protein n=1 Tax=Zea mays TaxID=4577 RepID=A0A1D6F6H7_MAIZE|nr:Lung seven transmembrane receptor family protein [Zea mays]